MLLLKIELYLKIGLDFNVFFMKLKAKGCFIEILSGLIWV